MYRQFYGLAQEPFGVTADPRFLYQSKGHGMALTLVLRAIRSRRGIMSLTGGCGTGKSTLGRALETGLGKTMTAVSLHYPKLERLDLLQVILHELGLEDATKPRGAVYVKDDDFYTMDPRVSGEPSAAARLYRLRSFALAELEKNRPPPLVILDEAQELTTEVLEELRLLSNLELRQTKLIQFLLIGQKSLEQKFTLPVLALLRQRVSVFSRVAPLASDEVGPYILHRLKVAGCRTTNLFTTGAVQTIARASSGIPRLVNALCDQALAHAHTLRKARVDAAEVAAAIQAVTPERHRPAEAEPPPPVRKPTTESTERSAPAPAPVAEPASAAPSSPSSPAREPQPNPRHAVTAISHNRRRSGQKPAPNPTLPERSDVPETLYGVRLATYQLAAQAKSRARQLVERGHDVVPVRAMQSDGSHVHHVMAGVYSQKERAQGIAKEFRARQIRAEVIELSGWSTSGTLHTKRSSKEFYLTTGKTPSPSPPRAGAPRSLPEIQLANQG